MANNENDESKILSSYDYISKLGNFKDLKNDNQLIESLQTIDNIKLFDNHHDLIKKGCDYKFPFRLTKILKAYHEVFSEQFKLDSENDMEFIGLLIEIVFKFSKYSDTFRKEFHESDGIRILFKYLSNDDLIRDYTNLIKNSKDRQDQLRKIVCGAIGALMNLSKSCSSFKDKWKNENSVERILNLSEQLKDIQDCQLSIYIILSNIYEENEITKFPNLMKIISNSIDKIVKITDNLEAMIDLTRNGIETDGCESIEKVSRITVMSNKWSLVELLDALYNMAVNDSIKESIYFDLKMNQSLRSIIKFGSQSEINCAVRLLWQLCFNSKIAEDVFDDKDFFQVLDHISKNSKNLDLTENISGCVWLVNQKHFGHIYEKKDFNRGRCMVFKDGRNDYSQHIMISYNRENRELCLKIKQDLEKNGHKVWIDVESIHGSGLESMAIAIEESKCVLICMTEKYKQSSNCRAEAEYAFQLNKPIIPLIMQENYKPDGWLGIILGSKIFVNFTKYDYDECVRRVKSELENLLKPHVSTINKTTVITPIRPIKDCVEDWNDEKVEDWFEEKNFNKVIHDNVFPSDGKILKQLYEMMQNAPEFVYTSISSNNVIPTRDVAYFASELKKLFK